MDLSNRMPVLVSSEGFPFWWVAGLFAAFLCPIHRVFRFFSQLVTLNGLSAWRAFFCVCENKYGRREWETNHVVSKAWAIVDVTSRCENAQQKGGHSYNLLPQIELLWLSYSIKKSRPEPIRPHALRSPNYYNSILPVPCTIISSTLASGNPFAAHDIKNCRFVWPRYSLPTLQSTPLPLPSFSIILHYPDKPQDF